MVLQEQQQQQQQQQQIVKFVKGAVARQFACRLFLVQDAELSSQPSSGWLAPTSAFDSDDESSGHIEDEHHAIFDCSGYTYARELFQDLCQSHITSISQFLNQPQCNRLAKFLIWIRTMRLNKA